MKNSTKYPVFFDPQNRRWRLFRLFFLIIGTVLGFVFCVLIASVFITPTLPSLSLGPVSLFPQPVHISLDTPLPTPTATAQILAAAVTPDIVTPNSPPVEFVSLKSKTIKFHSSKVKKNNKQQRQGAYPGSILILSDVGDLPSPTPQPTPTPQTPTPTQPIPLTPVPSTPAAPTHTEVIGFYVNWDNNSFGTLQQDITHIDKLIPEWLHLANGSGAIVPDDLVKQQQVITLIQQNRPGLPIMPLINNFNENTQAWDSNQLIDMLSNPTARAQNIQALLNFVQANHLQGISIDYENIPPESKNLLTTYMSELYGRFHPLGLEVSESVPTDDDGYDYPNLAKYTDYLILMAYDEHWSNSDAGPVESQQGFIDTLDQRLSEVDPSKYVVSIGNYGYDWPGQSNQGTDVSFEEAVQTARDYNGQVSLDPASLNPTFKYTDNNGISHQVWFLDAISAFNQLVAASKYPVRGFALWRMGSEDPSIWQVFDHRTNLDANAANSLLNLHSAGHLYYQGNGEILKVSSTPEDGQRTIHYGSATGLITAEHFVTYPSSYVISRWGASTKKLAITFDDGPDPQWTPKILDILKQYNAPATFFIIGSYGDASPGLLQRIVNEGNEVGNHTFTHPDISVISQTQLKVELNATERLFESVVGRGSILFRSPYSEDLEPSTPDQVKPLLLTGQLGYYNIGMNIDPSDYLLPGVNTIVQRVVDSATNGDGNVILLHDGGGDRSETIAALPLIIEALRARGYQLVLVSDLMGLTRDQVMPPISPQTQVYSTINDIAFQATNATNSVLSGFFIVGIFLGILRFLAIGTLATIEHHRTRRTYPADYQPTLSIIVPAYNEAKVIDKTINTLLNSTYPGLDIIVVDDGSSDHTYERVVELFGTNPRVHAFTKQNGGKAQALNFGIEQTRSEVIMVIDADTVILPDAAAKLVRHFANEHVAAVAGNAKVGNRINLLTRWQALEYITSQNLDRRAFALLNCITVVPGAIGAWRRQLVLDLGGFTSDTLAEDTDLTLRILRAGYKIEYEEEAIALTEAPDHIQAFIKQRFRWMYGTLQATWKQLNTLMNVQYGALGIVAIPNILIFQILFPLISPLMDLAAIASIGQIIMGRMQHPLHPSPDELTHLVVYYLLFLAFDFLTALFAFMFEPKEDWSLVVWLFLQRFFYRQLMYIVAIRSMAAAIRGRVEGWGKLERKATVEAPAVAHK